MEKKERRIVFAAGLVLLLIFTFTDLQISMAIAKKPTWARIFEVVGEIPFTTLTVGEHDFLKMETLGYGVKLHKAGVETKMVLYKGFGHAYFDNTGVYPQTEDCIDEMAAFILSHCGASL